MQLVGLALVVVAVVLGSAGFVVGARHQLTVQLLEPFDAATRAAPSLTDGKPGREVGPPMPIVTFGRKGLLERGDGSGDVLRSETGLPYWDLSVGRPLQWPVYLAGIAFLVLVVGGVGVVCLLIARVMRRLRVRSADHEFAELLAAMREQPPSDDSDGDDASDAGAARATPSS